MFYSSHALIAFCKSAATSKWYTYDDTKVTEMAENDVISNSAYLLFYQRRSANCCTVYQPDHWLHKVARIRFTDPPASTRHSQSQEDLLLEGKTMGRIGRNPMCCVPTRKRFIVPPPSRVAGSRMDRSRSCESRDKAIGVNVSQMCQSQSQPEDLYVGKAITRSRSGSFRTRWLPFSKSSGHQPLYAPYGKGDEELNKSLSCQNGRSKKEAFYQCKDRAVSTGALSSSLYRSRSHSTSQFSKL